MGKRIGNVALLWRGDGEARDAAKPQTSRFNKVFEALTRRDIHAEPAVYSEDRTDAVWNQLCKVDGVLVWVDPLSDGKRRTALDTMLREVASRGVWISTHPDTIMKMGVKEVLHRTKELGWGTDTRIYRSIDSFRREFPGVLKARGPRVLKRNRGNGGQGVWKVELLDNRSGHMSVRVLEARRGSVTEDIAFDAFMTRCEDYFVSDGCVIDQPFEPRLAEGMIRCYMGAGKVVGFGHQLVKALIPPPPDGPDSPAAIPGPRIMHPASAPQFERLRSMMESDWTPRMMQMLGIERQSLPIIWDADFLYGPPTGTGEDTYVLCEINVSSVFPIPDQAPEAIARLVEERLLQASARRRWPMPLRPD